MKSAIMQSTTTH